jgi:hypothetical protein
MICVSLPFKLVQANKIDIEEKFQNLALKYL